MSTAALTTMLVGMVVVWGGLAASIMRAVLRTRAARRSAIE